VIPQLELFAGDTPRFDAAFGSLRRIALDHEAWIDLAPGWVSDHAALFAELERTLDWRSEQRPMYDRIVDVPRLLAAVPDGIGLIEAMRAALSARYRETFVRTTAALYRDGNDSVAWHGDTTARDLPEAVVATVSLGEPRKFMLRPTAGGRSRAFPLGRGDLVVMGGTCQRTWRHAIPKVASAGPRMAVMFRPVWVKTGSK
jgi:alkylated DNA repair dioxygenase AlkB